MSRRSASASAKASESDSDIESKQKSLDATLTEQMKDQLRHLTQQLVERNAEKEAIARKMREKKQEIGVIEAAMQEILDRAGSLVINEPLQMGDIGRIKYVVKEQKKPITSKLLKEFFDGITNGDSQKTEYFLKELDNKREVSTKRKILQI